MDLAGKRVALYGRLLDHPWNEVKKLVEAAGGTVARDINRGTHVLVVGRGARNLIGGGMLARLHDAQERHLPVWGEQGFWQLLKGDAGEAATLPIAQTQPRPEAELTMVLAAFDLIRVDGENCRFRDAEILKSAAALVADGHGPAEIVRILTEREQAPRGRHRLVTGHAGDVRLQWGDGQTTLSGQGILDIDEPGTLDDAFENAMLAEAEGRDEEAERLYAICTRMDKRDPIAPFNLGNVLSRLGRHTEAIQRYGQAIARDDHFVEALFNRAVCQEARGNPVAAEADLHAALKVDPSYADALFNLGQLLLKKGDRTGAVRSFSAFLGTEPDAEWAARARQAKAVAEQA